MPRTCITANGSNDSLGGAANVVMMYNKVVIIGLGQFGLPAAKYLRETGFETYGYDNDKVR